MLLFNRSFVLFQAEIGRTYRTHGLQGAPGQTGRLAPVPSQERRAERTPYGAPHRNITTAYT